MSDMGKEADSATMGLSVSTRPDGGFNKLLYGQPQQVVEPLLHFDHPQAPTIRDLQTGDRRLPLLEEINPTAPVEQAFVRRAEHYAMDMNDRGEFWTKAGTGQMGSLGEVSTWLKGVAFTGDNSEKTFIPVRGSNTEGVTISWSNVQNEVSRDARLSPRELVARLIDGAAKLQAVKEGVQKTGSTLGISGDIDRMITVTLKAVQGVMDGRVGSEGGSLDEVAQWAKKKLMLAYGERIGLGIFGGALMGSAFGCAPQSPEMTATPVVNNPDVNSGAELHVPPIMGSGTEVAIQPVLETPTAEYGQSPIVDAAASNHMDIQVSNGQADMSIVSQKLAELGYNMADASNAEWMQVAKNGAETILRQVPGAVDVDFVLEGQSWILVPVDAQGNKIWAHDTNGNLLTAPVYYDSPALNNLGTIHLQSGELNPVYEVVPNSADAQVELVEGTPVFMRFGFVASDGYNSYVQLLDNGEWEFNQHGLKNFAVQNGIEVGNVEQKFAEHGIIQDTDGKLWDFDEATKAMVEMKANPEWNIIDLKVTDDGKIVATTFDRKELAYDEVNHEFVLLNPEPVSCIDPQQIEKIDAEFEARNNLSFDDLQSTNSGRIFAKALEEIGHIAFAPEPGVVGFSMLKTGFGIVDIEDKAGNGIDKLVCLYGRSPIIENETISVVVGWIGENGRFQALGDSVDDYHRKNVDRDTLLDFYKSMPDGAVVTLNGVHTFEGVTDPSMIQTPQKKRFPEQADLVRKLLESLGNNALERMSGVEDHDAFWAAQDPALGDQGFIQAGQTAYFDQIDLK